MRIGELVGVPKFFDLDVVSGFPLSCYWKRQGLGKKNTLLSEDIISGGYETEGARKLFRS
jgi:hypothetical protein